MCYNQFKAREVIFTNKTMYKCGVLKIKNFQFSSVIIFRETKYEIKIKYNTYNHNSRIFRRAFDSIQRF